MWSRESANRQERELKARTETRPADTARSRISCHVVPSHGHLDTLSLSIPPRHVPLLPRDPRTMMMRKHSGAISNL